MVELMARRVVGRVVRLVVADESKDLSVFLFRIKMIDFERKGIAITVD
jgi:hypothetical protein